MARFLILGAGRFGRLALERLSERESAAEFTLVDRDPRKVQAIPAQQGLRTITGSALAWLAESMAGADWPDWIIPAVPHHVAFDWLWLTRPPGAAWRQISVPEAVGQGQPFIHRGAVGELYLSLSTALCPDDCPSPAERCYRTSAPRKYNLYEYLEKLPLQDYTSLVIRSRQLAPGVGGYPPADLWQLRRRVLQLAGKFLISTACRCHGVVHALEIPEGTEALAGV
jgi:hypothetical protein